MGTNLLNENTIRRFMKLANVESLTDQFVNEMGTYKREDEDDDDRVDEQEEMEMDEDPEMDDDMGMDDEMDVDDEMDMDDDLGDLDDEGAADMSLTEEEAQLLISLGERLASAMEGSEEGDLDMGDEEGDLDAVDDMGAEPLDSEPMPGEDEEEDLGPAMKAMYESDNAKQAIVNEILKRVTKRIISERTSRK